MSEDNLKRDEVEGTFAAVDRLRNVGWAAPLLARCATILDKLRVGFEDKEAYRQNPITPAEASFLFEIRFADARAYSGLVAEYEHEAGMGDTTVDFRIDLDPPWMVELVSLHESDAFKKAFATGVEHDEDGREYVTFGYTLSTNASDPKQSEEGEVLKAQDRIAAKAFDRRNGPINSLSLLAPYT